MVEKFAEFDAALLKLVYGKIPEEVERARKELLQFLQQNEEHEPRTGAYNRARS